MLKTGSCLNGECLMILQYLLSLCTKSIHLNGADLENAMNFLSMYNTLMTNIKSRMYLLAFLSLR